MSLDPPRVLLDRSFLVAVLSPEAPDHVAARRAYLRLVDDFEDHLVRPCALAPDLTALAGPTGRERRTGPLAPVESVHVGLQHRRDARRMLGIPSDRSADLTRLSPYTVGWCLAGGAFALMSSFTWHHGRDDIGPWHGMPLAAGALPVLLFVVALLVDVAHALHPRVRPLPAAVRAGGATLALALVVWGAATVPRPGDRVGVAFVVALGLALVASLAAVLVLLQQHGLVGHPKEPRQRHDDIDADLALLLVVCHRERIRRVATLDPRLAAYGLEPEPLLDR